MLLLRLEVASFSYPFTVFVLALAAGLTIDRRASAAEPLNRASAIVWTRAMLRDIFEVGRWSVMYELESLTHWSLLLHNAHLQVVIPDNDRSLS